MTMQLPANLASRQRRSVIEDMTAGIGSSRGPHISIRGGRFWLVTAAGMETAVQTFHLDIVIVDANKHPAKVFFDGPYVQGQDVPPVCFSDNGTGPSTQSMEPQSPTCAICPWNARGSDTTFSGQPTKACQDRKKVAAIIPDDPTVTVYEFQIPPGSVTNLKAYSNALREQPTNVAGRKLDVADVVTRVTFDPAKQFTMLFQAVALADDDRTIQLIDYIDANKLADVAVGRNDVACDPGVVTARLAASPAMTQLAPPAAQPAPQQPYPGPAQVPTAFALPPQAPPAALAGPAATAPAAAPQPARRGRRPAANGAGVQAPGAAAPPNPAAPFMAAAQQPQPPAPQQAPQGQGNVSYLPPQQGQQAPAAQLAPQPPLEVPAFLQRTPNNMPPNIPAPQFGVQQSAPQPPPAVANALAGAMSLPTRR